ncbi:FAD-dependent oxidoreductase [PVC group bacterium]|nr:FAD-dependent oxidoreductase [PVC group bacterium]
MKNLKFDIVFIGGGAGGLFGASVAKALGAKACIIDKKRLGGDCTWYGCVPSKALLKSSQVARLLKNASQFGLKTSGVLEFEYGSIMDHVRDVVNDIVKHHEPEDFQKRGIE